MKLPNFNKYDKLYYGLDLAKKDSQLAVLDASGKELRNFRFRSKRENFLSLARSLSSSDTIALEVSTSANAVMSIFKKQSAARSILSNPMKTKLISSPKLKTDKVDARVLAELARVDYLPTVWTPDEDTLRLRHFYTDRETLVTHRTQFKNQIHSVLHRNLVDYEHIGDLFGKQGLAFLVSLLKTDTLDAYERDRIRFLLKEIERQDALIEDIDQTIAAFISSHAVFSHQLDLLVSIPGVSLVTGGAFLAAIGDISRFSKAKKLASYFGLTPRVKQSGETKWMGAISKEGCSYARFMATEAAEHLRKVPLYKRRYNRIKRKKNHNVAKVAIARQLIELVWRLLTRNEEFLYSLPRSTDEKRARIRKMASQKSGLKFGRKPTNTALYGTSLRGREIKQEIVKRANNEAIRIAKLMELGKKLSEISPTGSNPKNPTQANWQKLLEIIAKDYARELAQNEIDKTQNPAEENKEEAPVSGKNQSHKNKEENSKP